MDKKQVKQSECEPGWSETANRCLLFQDPMKYGFPDDYHGEGQYPYGSNAVWGSNLALTQLSCNNTGYWHSSSSDSNPWISFKMSVISTFIIIIIIIVGDEQTGVMNNV